MSAGGFLSRWSKRKLAASLSAASQPAAAEAGMTAGADAKVSVDAAADPSAGVAGEARDRAAVEAALPPVEELTLASDFTAFLKEEVSESLRRQALKKLFADPHFNQMDGLDIYIDDYSIADPIPPSMMEKLRHAREWLDDVEEKTEDEAAGAREEVANEAVGEADGAPRAVQDDDADVSAEAGAASGSNAPDEIGAVTPEPRPAARG